MYIHTYMIEINQNLVEEVFRKRKKRKIGNIELYLSVMPQDIPKVIIKNVVVEKKIIIEFKFTDINVEDWNNILMYKDEQFQLEIYQNFIYKIISLVKFPLDKIKEFKLAIDKVKQEIEEELINMEWDGKKVAELDMKERQLDFLIKPEVIQVIETLIKMHY